VKSTPYASFHTAYFIDLDEHVLQIQILYCKAIRTADTLCKSHRYGTGIIISDKTFVLCSTKSLHWKSHRQKKCVKLNVLICTSKCYLNFLTMVMMFLSDIDSNGTNIMGCVSSVLVSVEFNTINAASGST